MNNKNLSKENFNNAIVLSWCKVINGKLTISKTEEEGYTPYEVKRISDNTIFKVGDRIKYPNIHLADVYPINNFRIEIKNNVKDILINGHNSLNGLRSINNWSKS